MAKNQFDNRRAQLRAMQHAEAKKRRNRNIVIGVVCGVIALVVIAGGVTAFLQLRDNQEASLPPSANADRTGMILNPDAPDSAPKLDIYFDYQCPFCKQFEDQMSSTIEDMAESNDARITYHTMTFLDRNLQNDASQRAANAAYCADAQGRYNEYHVLVYQNQPTQEGQGYTDELLRDQLPQQAGITDLAAFQSCYDDQTYDGYVRKVDNEAGKAGVTGTPTVHVNGEELDLQGITDPESFRRAVLG